MSTKYMQLEIEALPDVSEEDYKKMPEDDRRQMALRVMTGMKYRMFVLAIALLKFGKHEDSCTDENVCTCGFTPIQDIALDIVEHMENDPGLKEVSLN